MRAGRGRGIRDLLAVERGQGGSEMHFGKQCERCASSIIGGVVLLSRLYAQFLGMVIFCAILNLVEEYTWLML